MFRGRRVPVQTYLAWVGARPIAVDQAIAGALPPPTAEQRDHLGAFHVIAEVQECNEDFLLVCVKRDQTRSTIYPPISDSDFLRGIQFSFFEWALFS
jgi:hypothetical protein